MKNLGLKCPVTSNPAGFEDAGKFRETIGIQATPEKPS
jgi:hypothetical protein